MDLIKLFLSMFAMYLPMVLVCLGAGVVVLIKWRNAPTAALWALLGFGLGLFLCFAMPIGHTLLQQWVFRSGEQASRMWVFSTFSIAGSVLHAVVYVFLLVAIFAGRLKPDSTIPPSFSQP